MSALASTDAPSRRASVFRSQALGATAAYSVSFIAVAISLPLLVRGLGAHAYGAWVLTGGLVNLLGPLDFGFSLTVTRFVAQDFVSDRERACRAVSVGLAGVLIVGVVFASLAVSISGLASNWLRVPHARYAMIAAGFAFAALLVTKVMQSALEGAGAVAVSRWLQALGSVVFSVGVVLFSALHLESLKTLSSLLLGQVVFVLVCLFFASIARFRGSPCAMPTRATVKAVTKYALAMQAASFAAVVIEPASRLIVGTVVGPSAVAPLDIAARTRSQLFGAALAFTRPLIARLGAFGHDRHAAAAMMRETTIVFSKVAVSGGMIVALIILRTFGPLFSQGAGSSVPELSAAAVLLWMPAVLALPAYAFILVAGRAKDIVAIQMSTSITALAVAVALVPFIGLWAPIIGLGLGATVGAILTARVARSLVPTKRQAGHVDAGRLSNVSLAVGTVGACAIGLAPLPAVPVATAVIALWLAGSALSLHRLLVVSG
jgi:O-antigen/teichoic acid export membrane protein